MSNKSKPNFKRKLATNFLENPNSNWINLVQKLYSRELGLSSSLEFIVRTKTCRLDQLKLSKCRSIPTFTHSLTWMSLDNVENRFLLVARSDGRFNCFDTFQKESNSNLKETFLLRPSANGAHEYSISCVQWYPIDSGMFFTSGKDNRFKVWDTNRLQVVDEYNLKHKIYNHSLSLMMSSSSKTLIALALNNGEVRFVDLNSGSFTHTLKAHPNSYCVCVQWSPYDSNILASAGSDGRIALWDIRSSKSCLMHLDYEKTKFKQKGTASAMNSSTSNSMAHSAAVIGLNFTLDGNHIISLGKDNTLRLWESFTGLNTLVNYGHVPLGSAVAESCLQISCTELCYPNYVFLPSSRNLLMYSIFDGELKHTFKGHFDSINCALYNPVQNEVYTGSKDRNCLVWSAEPHVNSSKKRKVNEAGSGQSVYTIFSSANRSSSASGNRLHGDWSDDE